MTSSRRSLDEIETELDHNREQMGHTLDALQHRLSAEDIVERTRNALRSSGADEFLINLEHSVRRNPLPLAVFGIGLGWLMISGSDRARRGIDRYSPNRASHGEPSAAGDMASKAQTQAGSAARSVRDGVTHTAESGRGTVDEVSRRARAGASRLSETTSAVFERADTLRREQPLVTATIGLAVGAIVAATLPRSNTEDRALGAVRDDVVTSARETGQEKAGQAQDVAESAVHAASDAAKSEAERQDLRSQSP